MKETNVIDNIRKLHFGNSTILDSRYIHQDGYLAINVKWYYPKLNKNVYDREKVGEYLTYTFWEKACEIAISFGYSGCHSYGRTGGWAIPYFTKNTKCEYIKATSGKSISNDISLENFKAFASYIEKLWRLIDIEAKTIETENQLIKLQSRIEEL